MRNPLIRFWQVITAPENVWALVLFLIVAALIVFTNNDGPSWIYQGF